MAKSFVEKVALRAVTKAGNKMGAPRDEAFSVFSEVLVSVLVSILSGFVKGCLDQNGFVTADDVRSHANRLKRPPWWAFWAIGRMNARNRVEDMIIERAKNRNGNNGGVVQLSVYEAEAVLDSSVEEIANMRDREIDEIVAETLRR